MVAPELRLRSPSPGLLSLPWERPLADWLVPDVPLRDMAAKQRSRLLDGMASQLVELHRRGVFWVHPHLSDGQRELDVDVTVENVGAGLMDIACDLLEVRWLLSEQAGRDVGTERALAALARSVVPTDSAAQLMVVETPTEPFSILDDVD